MNHRTTPDGHMKVWINGEFKYDYKGITTRHEGKPYFKLVSTTRLNLLVVQNIMTEIISITFGFILMKLGFKLVQN